MIIIKMRYLFTLFFLLFFSNQLLANELTTTFYGIFDISLQSVDNEQINENTYLQSNGSRVGILFSQPINEDYAFVTQLESAVDFNTNRAPGKHFSTRNTWIGVDSPYGRLLMGRHDTPMKWSQDWIDLFTDTDVQLWPLIRGENRVSDILLFRSSSWNNWSVDLGWVDNPDHAKHDKGQSFALKYQTDNYFGAIAFDRDIFDYDVLRQVNSYETGPIYMGSLIQRSRSTETGRVEWGHMFSAKYSFNEKLALKLQYQNSDEIIKEGKFKTVGLEWTFSKRTQVYILYSDRDGIEPKDKGSLLSLGFKYNFEETPFND